MARLYEKQIPWPPSNLPEPPESEPPKDFEEKRRPLEQPHPIIYLIAYGVPCALGGLLAGLIGGYVIGIGVGLARAGGAG
jgi:hypothetical protein